MRYVKKELGLITEEEFLEQEEIADKMKLVNINDKFGMVGRDKHREKQLEIENKK